MKRFRFPALLLIIAAHSLPAQETASADGLRATVLRQDSVMFHAFNTCDTLKLASFFAPDVEFYHDLTGLTTGREANVAIIADRCRRAAEGAAPRLHRQLVQEASEVYPVPEFGAIQIGRHRFGDVAADGTVPSSAEFRFVHVWRVVRGAWSVSRIVSFAH